MTSRPVRPRSRLTLEPGLRELGGEAFVLNKFLEGQLGTVCFVARREHGRRGGLPGLGPEVGEFGGEGLRGQLRAAVGGEGSGTAYPDLYAEGWVGLAFPAPCVRGRVKGGDSVLPHLSVCPRQ